jgi:hypothetical protein
MELSLTKYINCGFQAQIFLVGIHLHPDSNAERTTREESIEVIGWRDCIFVRALEVRGSCLVSEYFQITNLKVTCSSEGFVSIATSILEIIGV